MADARICNPVQFACLTILVLLLAENLHGKPMEHPDLIAKERSHYGILNRRVRSPKKTSVPTAPLDPNDNIHHTLDEVNSILGTVGGAASGAVMGLTGISITDCGLSVKDEDLSAMSCTQFIDTISECDSLAHIKPLLQQAKDKYKKKGNKKPCFKRGKSGRK